MVREQKRTKKRTVQLSPLFFLVRHSSFCFGCVFMVRADKHFYRGNEHQDEDVSPIFLMIKFVGTVQARVCAK